MTHETTEMTVLQLISINPEVHKLPSDFPFLLWVGPSSNSSHYRRVYHRLKAKLIQLNLWQNEFIIKTKTWSIGSNKRDFLRYYGNRCYFTCMIVHEPEVRYWRRINYWCLTCGVIDTYQVTELCARSEKQFKEDIKDHSLGPSVLAKADLGDNWFIDYVRWNSLEPCLEALQWIEDNYGHLAPRPNEEPSVTY
jgi:hypothetical protein